jgi:flagellar basal-body rod protein FlgB
MKLDDALGIHAKALPIRGERARLLASNLANADTPGYLATDINFQETLRNELDGKSILQTTNAAHFSTPGGQGPEVLYRNPYQPSIDGNTVDTQIEQAAFAENALGYEASLRFLDSRISGLIQAIKGE